VGYDPVMRIGIIGSDARAAAIGRLLLSDGHDVSSQAGVGEAEIPYRQACTREILVLAVPSDRIDEALTAVGSGIESQAIVDATDGKPGAFGNSQAELLAHKLDSHRVVRALITLPQAGASIPICGDDPTAKQLVKEAFEACKCVVTDRGPLANASELERPRAA
jgi:predicted dinucleotide-binding enzyme